MRCASDDVQSNSSEFGSADEEVEYGLYTQLYFEPNPDITAADTASKGLTKIQPKANVIQKTYQNVFEKYLIDSAQKSNNELTKEDNVKTCQLDGEVNNQNPTNQCSGTRDHTSTYTDLENDINCSPKASSKSSDDTLLENDINCSQNTNSKTCDDTVQKESNCPPKTSSKTVDDTVPEIDSNCSQKTGSETLNDTVLEIESDCSPETSSKTSDVSSSALTNTNKETQEICAQKPDSNQCPSTSSNVCMASDEVHALPTGRKKFSSICSEGNIPGSIPLDDLYCHVALSDEDIQEEDIGNRLAIIDSNVLREKNESETQNISRKRKRDGGIDSSDSEEESRCSNLVNSASKNKRVAESTELILFCESDTESDVCIIPPPTPKQPLVFTLDSSSDNELLAEKGKKRSANETQVREDESALPAKRTCTGKPEIAHERSESLQDPDRIVIGVDNKKRKHRAEVYNNSKPNHVIFIDSDSESDSDSCLTQGTDLTLNVNKQLSVWIEKLTKDGSNDTSGHTNVLDKKHSGPVVSHSVDLNENQSETREQPKYNSWTQEMLNFYEKDLPEDLQVRAVHKQQSNDKRDWQIIRADYQIKCGVRYFSQEKRCTLCRQYGHLKKDCDRVAHCHLCSGVDHTLRRDCPENCCFRCGGRAHVFCPDTASSVSCNLCGYQGHRSDLCPDLWRRFHLTTSGLKANIPLGPITRPEMERFCYNCGQRGHYGHDCPTKYENRSYCQVPQSICSYSTPVYLVNGSFVVNEESDQTMNSDILRIPVEDKYIKYIIGHKGMMIKEIKRRTGAGIWIFQEEGGSQVCLYGSSEAQSAAKAMIDVLLARKLNGDRKCYFKNIPTVKNQDLNLGADGTRMSHSVLNENDSIVDGYVAPSIWYNDFFRKLVRSARNKQGFIGILRKEIKSLNKFSGNISNCLPQLQKYQVRLKRGSPCFTVMRNAKKNLIFLARCVIGREKYGPGKCIHEHLENLIESIQSSSKKVIPRKICEDIAQTLGQVYDPSLEKLDELMEYATQYLLSCKSFPDTKKKGFTSKKKKAQKVGKKRKKKEQGGQGILSVPKNVNTDQREERNELQLGEAKEKVKLIKPQKDNPKKTKFKPKVKKRKNNSKMNRINKQQHKKSLQQILLKNDSPSIVHTHEQVMKEVGKKTETCNLQTGKKD